MVCSHGSLETVLKISSEEDAMDGSFERMKAGTLCWYDLSMVVLALNCRLRLVRPDPRNVTSLFAISSE
jgi:hypothetical protein